MDYFAPYNRALEKAGEVSDNGLAQAYKLHDFETKQRAAKLQYEAQKLAYDDVKRKHELETEARQMAASAQPTPNPEFGAYQAGIQGPPVIPQNPEYAALQQNVQGNPAFAQMTGADKRLQEMPQYDVSRAQYPGQGVAPPPEMNPVNKIKTYIDTIAAKDPAMAMEMKSKLYEEFKKQVPPGISAADALAKFNEFFGENNVAAPTKKDLMVAPKNSQIIDAAGNVIFDNRQEQQGKIVERTVPLGDRVKIYYTDGTTEYEKINQRPGTAGGGGGRGGGMGGGKPLPPAAMNKVLDAQTALDTASRITTNTQQYIDMLENGDLKLGLVGNAVSGARNYTGMSNAASQNYTSFKTYLAQLRNEILTLAKGVQTDGDALRAYNTLVDNINDENVVKNQLMTIQANNANNARLQENQIRSIYENYNKETPDTTPFSTAPPSVAPSGGRQKPVINKPRGGFDMSKPVQKGNLKGYRQPDGSVVDANGKRLN